LKGDKQIETLNILETEIISEDKTIHLKLYREIKEIEKIKKFKLLYRTIWLMMKREIMRK
jgi:hypothetical protein